MAFLWRLCKHRDYQSAYGRSRRGNTRQITYFFAVRALPGGEESRAATAVEGVGGVSESEETRESAGSLADALAEENAGRQVRGAVKPFGPRVGLTVPKAVGKAHERNRIKRRMREIVRAEVGRLEGGAVDVILHPRRSAMESEFGVLRREVAEIFGRVRRAMVEPEAEGARRGGAAGARGRPGGGRGGRRR